MGIQVGRIEQEFVFKVLAEEGAALDVHGNASEVRCSFESEDSATLTLSLRDGWKEQRPFIPGEEVRVFFYLKNNYHTFSGKVVSADEKRVVLEQPKGVYKNLQRKYERVKVPAEIEVSFNLKGRKIELNFPKSERFGMVEPPELSDTFDPHRLHDLVRDFRSKIGTKVSVNTISMLRDRLPRSWEEKTVVRLGKSLWIPSTEEDFPETDPYPEARTITKSELMAVEAESGSTTNVAQSKLGNILYEKSKKGIYSELYCPILYNEYVVGYIYVSNGGDKREKISREMYEGIYEFGRILCYSLVENGYFKAEKAGERRYEAPIVDISASGLLFRHPAGELSRELHVHSDLDMTIRVQKRVIQITARIMRKFKDSENSYFGVLFMKMVPEDFRFLFEFLYGKKFEPKYEVSWEGGAPPPPVEL